MQVNAITGVNIQKSTQDSTNFQKTMPEGKSVEVVVESIKGNSLTLKFENGTRVTAKITTAMQVAVGDVLELVSSGTGSGSLSLKLSSVNGQELNPVATPIEHLVLSSKLAANNDLMVAAQLMLQMGLPVTEAALEAFASAMTKQNTIDAKAAAFLAAQGVPITPENVKTLLDLVSNQSPKELFNMLQELSAKLPNQPQAQDPAQDPALLQTPEQAQNQATTLQAPIGEPAVLNTQAPLTQATPIPQTPEQVTAAITQQLDPQTVKIIATTPELAQELNTLTTQIANGTPISDKQLEAFAQKFPSSQQEAVVDSFIALARNMQKTQGSQTVLQNTADLTPNQQVLVQEGLKLFANLKSHDPDASSKLQKALSSLPRLFEALQDAPDTPASSTLQRMLTQSSTQVVNQTRMGGEFTHFLYTPVPFTFNQEQQNANLYVMKRKPGKPIDPDNTTFLLSLETPKFGQVDSVVKIEQRKMNVQFFVENPESRTAFLVAMPALKTLIADTKYTLVGASVDITKEKLSPFNAAAAGNAAKKNVQPVSGINITV